MTSTTKRTVVALFPRAMAALLRSVVLIFSCGVYCSYLLFGFLHAGLGILAAAVVVVCGVPRFSRSVGTLASLLCRRLTGTDTYGEIHSCGLRAVGCGAAGRTGLLVCSCCCDSDLHWPLVQSARMFFDRSRWCCSWWRWDSCGVSFCLTPVLPLLWSAVPQVICCCRAY
jgi:hypothetical protein